jgi:hypothetical protein
MSAVSMVKSTSVICTIEPLMIVPFLSVTVSLSAKHADAPAAMAKVVCDFFQFM